jgi:hypothetical protein
MNHNALTVDYNISRFFIQMRTHKRPISFDDDRPFIVLADLSGFCIMSTTAQPPPAQPPPKSPSSGLEMPSIEWPSLELPQVDFNEWVCCVSERKTERVSEKFVYGQESMYGRLATVAPVHGVSSGPKEVPEVILSSSLADGGTG